MKKLSNEELLAELEVPFPFDISHEQNLEANELANHTTRGRKTA